jgi:hypothetical protein
MTNGKTPQELLEETHDNVMKLSVVLLGVPDSEEKGLCGDFAELRTEFYKFRRFGIWVIGILAGSGVLGVGVFEVVSRGL